jgi:hypothetical protein
MRANAEASRRAERGEMCPLVFEFSNIGHSTISFIHKYIENCIKSNPELCRYALTLALTNTQARQTFVDSEQAAAVANSTAKYFPKDALFGTLLHNHTLTSEQKVRASKAFVAFRELLDESNYETDAVDKLDDCPTFIQTAIRHLFEADVVASDLLRKSNSPAGGSRRKTRRSRRGSRKHSRKH